MYSTQIPGEGGWAKVSAAQGTAHDEALGRGMPGLFQ